MKTLAVFLVALMLAGCGSAAGASYVPADVGPTPSSSSASSVTPAPPAAATPHAAMSVPTAIYLPDPDPAKEIRTEPKALACGSTIPYPTSGPDVWRAFYCTDRALPGSDMPHYGIITGHSTRSGATDTTMNRLLAHLDTLVGREILIRTKASGSRWLVFRFTSVEHVAKNRLGQATALWGTPTSSTAGRLVFLTCGQSRYGTDPDDNIGMVAQYVGMR